MYYMNGFKVCLLQYYLYKYTASIKHLFFVSICEIKLKFKEKF